MECVRSVAVRPREVEVVLIQRGLRRKSSSPALAFGHRGGVKTCRAPQTFRTMCTKPRVCLFRVPPDNSLPDASAPSAPPNLFPSARSASSSAGSGSTIRDAELLSKAEEDPRSSCPELCTRTSAAAAPPSAASTAECPTGTDRRIDRISPGPQNFVTFGGRMRVVRRCGAVQSPTSGRISGSPIRHAASPAARPPPNGHRARAQHERDRSEP